MQEEVIDWSLSSLKNCGDECSFGCLFLLGSMAEIDEVRALLIARGCISVVVEMLKLEKEEVKRAAAYLLALFAEQRDSHRELCKCGALEAIICIASTPDGECQEHGSFALVHLSENPEIQLQLARLGAVRSCVSLLSINAESKHYAALALLKLASNFENHLIIAEQGGIQALLRLGRSQIVNEELQYRAAVAVGNLANNAIKSFEKA
jgi:hypothetical protein